VRIEVVHPVEARSSVDLPQPDGPMKAVTLVVERQVDVLQRAMLAVEEVEIAMVILGGASALIAGRGQRSGRRDSWIDAHVICFSRAPRKRAAMLKHSTRA
jgi:hypothetical protein